METLVYGVRTCGEPATRPSDLGEYLRRTYSRTITKITSMEKPVVAALHGPVYGAGVGLGSPRLSSALPSAPRF